MLNRRQALLATLAALISGTALCTAAVADNLGHDDNIARAVKGAQRLLAMVPTDRVEKAAWRQTDGKVSFDTFADAYLISLDADFAVPTTNLPEDVFATVTPLTDEALRQKIEEWVPVYILRTLLKQHSLPLNASCNGWKLFTARYARFLLD